MLTCDRCGCTEFMRDSGFMYCSGCSAQSQEYVEQELISNSATTKAKKVTPTKRKKEERKLKASDCWISWDAFNYILYGMTKELRELDLISADVQDLTLQFWACCLRTSKVAFLSRSSEQRPTAAVALKPRDLMVLYGLNSMSSVRKRKKSKGSSVSQKTASTSSAYTFKQAKKKFFAASYEQYSLSKASDKLAINETIESIDTSGRSETTDCDSRQSFERYSSSRSLKILHNKSKIPFCKSKLLELIHLSLLMSGSKLQLSDLLRFIREGHLSYAKVTHFFPDDITLFENDHSFLESITDAFMPTHLMQRNIGGKLVKILCIKEFPLPNMRSLMKRYCRDLNLPDVISRYAYKVFENAAGKKQLNVVGRYGRKSTLPNFEGLAAACILFVMKILFGLDGVTELLLSDLAIKINNVQPEGNMFVFTKWQKFIECRKAVLYDYHYPTQEKLGNEDPHDSNGIAFFDMLMKESKDEHRDKRFTVYKQYRLRQSVTTAMKDTLDTFTEPFSHNFLNFPPSLTPQTSYLDIILQACTDRQSLEDESQKTIQPVIEPEAVKILKEDFKNCLVDFIFDPEAYDECLKKSGFKILKKLKSDYRSMGIISEKFGESLKETSSELETEEYKKERRGLMRNISDPKTVVFVKDLFNYWLLMRTAKVTRDYELNVLSKFPINFRWLLTEFSMMLEMNTKEIYAELNFIEREFLADSMKTSGGR